MFPVPVLVSFHPSYADKHPVNVRLFSMGESLSLMSVGCCHIISRSEACDLCWGTIRGLCALVVAANGHGMFVTQTMSYYAHVYFCNTCGCLTNDMHNTMWLPEMSSHPLPHKLLHVCTMGRNALHSFGALVTLQGNGHKQHCLDCSQSGNKN